MISFHLLDLVLFFLPFIIIFIILKISQEKQNKTLKEYFQAEGSMTWFVSGTAMVATTFAADTPLAVTEIVRSDGISGNWLWWYMSLSGLVTVFFFSRLWKRSGAMTDLELIHIRYSGSEANVLRGFKAIFIGGILNLIILGWVNLAMLKIIQVFFPVLPDWQILTGIMVLGIVYTAIGGLRGISYIDVFQFFLAWFGCILYAYFVLDVKEIGGIQSLVQNLKPEQLYFFPSFGSSGSLPLSHFIIMLTVIWWSSWYPGSEPGGGGYIAQRILATKDEKAAVKSSLWFVLAHYFLRPWPWILVALASLIAFPNLTAEESGKGFLLFLQLGLPPGIKGLLLSAFLAAYLSTVATHLNWGASYLVSDFWKPFVKPKKEDQYYLKVSYLVQTITGALSILLAIFGLETIKGAWVFLLEASSGIGFILIARWYYWKITAKTEILAIILSPVLYIIASRVLGLIFPYTVVFTSFLSIFILLFSTWIFPPTDLLRLKSFYETTKPPHYFWRGLYKRLEEKQPEFSSNLLFSFLGVFSGFSVILIGLLLIKAMLWDREMILSYAVGFAFGSTFLVYSIRKFMEETRT
ncbi:sodium/proline symporter [Leptospira ryugenii]|uniref:Sodium/proline symporter n=1 Tax=Leptospira ryugenii TaxID=1917863 RepID=A0A2P2DWY0_9LEPT|nr:sodium:solute symporter family protein [Leptospira ryugenii]GBF49116.1 sodium/proline symporter [Leptospira ryugenii]